MGGVLFYFVKQNCMYKLPQYFEKYTQLDNTQHQVLQKNNIPSIFFFL